MLAGHHERLGAAPICERVAGRYELVERLAKGGMGEVWRARELATGRELALKRLLPKASRRQAWLRAEYHTLARLKHPFIIEVYEFGLDRTIPYYTMELLDGHDLRECPQLSVQEGCRILRDVACCLSLLHAQKLLHRDISPRNVRRTSAGVCKLMDFGAMIPFGVAPEVAGTPGFISPEAREGAVLDQRADLYSLGALAYWLFSRRLPPAPGGSGGVLAPVGRLAKEVSPALDALVMSLLALDPGKRPSSAAEVIARLSAIAGLSMDDTPALARSHLSSSTFVGQGAALSRADRALQRSAVGNGGALLVESEPGSGKTRFLQELSLLAQTRGFSVIRAFASPPATGVHIAHELYRGLRRAAPEIFNLLPAERRSVLSGFDWREASPATPRAAETRASLQWALSDYLQTATQSGPWLVLIDDLDRADEFSLSFAAALAAMAENLPLLVVGTSTRQTSSDAPLLSPFAAFGARAKTICLTDFDEATVGSLVAQLFGRVSSRERLVRYLYREAKGNPGLTLELCSWLIERGVIRYRDGEFILPQGDIHEELPADAGRALTRKLDGLDETARELVALIATCRGGASLELCLAACQRPSDAVLSALGELVARGVLKGSGSDYVFEQDALRTAVRRSIAEDHARSLHVRLAHAYLFVERSLPLHQLEAAWHLIHTEQELQGAELLHRVAPPLIEAGVAYREAIFGLEKALDVFERRAGPLEKILDIRVLLARAAYLYDYRLAERHGARTMALLCEWCGVTALSKWPRLLGAPLAALACILLMLWRRLRRPAARRGPPPIRSLNYLLSATLSFMGVRVTGLDGKGARELLHQLEIFRRLSRFSPAATAYKAAEALSLQPLGREAELRRALARALSAIERQWPSTASQAQRQDLRVGLLLSQGMNECYRTGSTALGLADVLELEGTRLARTAANRIRFTYYVVRGMREKAEAFRREIDICGIQGGTTWQVEWFAVPTEGMASALLGDLVGTGRALERLEQLVLVVPSMAPMRDMVKLGYHLCRGEHDAAIALGERFVATYPPRTVIGWGAAYSAYAAALNRTGRPAQAAALCESALAALSDEDQEYIIMYGPLVRELTMAWAQLGELERAIQHADRHAAALEAAGEYALLAHAYEVRALMARVARDHSLLAHALVAMREAAQNAGSITVIEQAAKATQASLRATSEIPVAASDPLVMSADNEVAESDESFEPSRRSRQRTLLARVCNRAEAEIALVFGLTEDRVPHLLASAGAARADAFTIAPLVVDLFERGPNQLATHLAPSPVQLQGGRYELVYLPRADLSEPPAILLLLHARRAKLERLLDSTLLARLSERVRSTLFHFQQADSETMETVG